MTFKAGSYYIGSLAPVLRYELASIIKQGFNEIKISELKELYPNSDFSDLGELCADPRGQGEQVADEKNKIELLQYANFYVGTKDGTLCDSSGFKYSIEGEHIGIISLEALSKSALDTKLLTYRHNRVCSKFSEFNYGRSVHFSSDFKLSLEGDILNIADITIKL